jgi:uncharacterized protein (DUF1800 family)
MSPNTAEAIMACRRFGLGASAADFDAMGGDPRGWLAAQCGRPEQARLDRADLRPAPVLFRELLAHLAEAAEASNDMEASAKPGMEPAPKLPVAETYRKEVAARATHAVETPAPFAERLVMFWANHFAVSTRRSGRVAITAGAFEREAIRPHALGSFRTMVGAVASHTSMMLYLDAPYSVGPGSIRARRRPGAGLNENFARELMELHVLGVDGGYDQEDVKELALALTGWTFHMEGRRTGEFLFNPTMHEPGGRRLLGRTLPPGGRGQGEAALDFLTSRAAAARYLAGKLCTHFVRPQPPPALVDRIAATFLETGGNLAEVARTLVGADEAWIETDGRVLPPYDQLVAAHRGFAAPVGADTLADTAARLGQPVWGPPSPEGWSDEADAWLVPAGLVGRLTWAREFASSLKTGEPVAAIVDRLLGPAADDNTRRQIEAATSREEALALVLMSPAFLLR